MSEKTETALVAVASGLVVLGLALRNCRDARAISRPVRLPDPRVSPHEHEVGGYWRRPPGGTEPTVYVSSYRRGRE